jgi:GNAT superfamily N-acetyltransferase
MNLLIEKLTLEQAPQFYSVFTAVMNDGYDYSPKIKEHFINNAYSLANYEYWIKYNYKSILISQYVSEIVPKIVGFLVYDAPYGGVVLCRWLGVLKEWRGKGIGKKLVDEFISQAKTMGCHKIELCGQPSAEGFYKKYGLAKEGFRPKSYFGQDQYLFGKVIREVDEEKIIKCHQ